MIEIKQALIVSEGVPVTVTAIDGTVTDTNALIGRGSRTANSSAVTLESNRKGQFLPSVTVGGGSIVNVPTSGEDCIIVAAMKEVIQGQLAAIVTHMYVCNARVTVSGVEETADENGNRTKTPVVKASDLQSFIETLTAELRQYDPGLHSDAEYRIYCPSVDITLLDKITVIMNGRSVPLKVVATDYLSYEGVVVIQVCSETRK
jgi:uncharacterized Zn-binding protein involved in type VI secretion